MDQKFGAAGKKPEGAGGSCGFTTAGGQQQKEKTSWPELVGKSIDEAKKVILKDKPDAQIEVLPVGSPATRDYKAKRVRIFVGTVAEVPNIG